MNVALAYIAEYANAIIYYGYPGNCEKSLGLTGVCTLCQGGTSFLKIKGQQFDDSDNYNVIVKGGYDCW